MKKFILIAAAAVALSPIGVAHANPADDACRATAMQQLQSGVPGSTVNQNLIACQSGASPNNGQAYVPGKAGPGPQPLPGYNQDQVDQANQSQPPIDINKVWDPNSHQFVDPPAAPPPPPQQSWPNQVNGAICAGIPNAIKPPSCP
jgi:hypothetical protein